MITSIIEMLQYDFIQRAIITGIAIAISAALLGTTIIPRRQSMLGDGLSHVAFGASAIAISLSFSPLYTALPCAIAASIIITKFANHKNTNSESLIAITSASALAIGTLIISISGSNIDLNAYLFGSILAVSQIDLIASLIVALIAVACFIIFRKKIFAITIDNNFAKSIKINTDFYDLVISILCASIVVIGMKALGALLISSLLIFPVSTAIQFTKNFRQTCIASTVISCICLTIGFTLSYAYSTPSGACIVLVNLAAFILANVYRKI